MAIKSIFSQPFPISTRPASLVEIDAKTFIELPKPRDPNTIFVVHAVMRSGDSVGQIVKIYFGDDISPTSVFPADELGFFTNLLLSQQKLSQGIEKVRTAFIANAIKVEIMTSDEFDRFFKLLNDAEDSRRKLEQTYRIISEIDSVSERYKYSSLIADGRSSLSRFDNTFFLVELSKEQSPDFPAYAIWNMPNLYDLPEVLPKPGEKPLTGFINRWVLSVAEINKAFEPLGPFHSYSLNRPIRVLCMYLNNCNEVKEHVAHQHEIERSCEFVTVLPPKDERKSNVWYFISYLDGTYNFCFGKQDRLFFDEDMPRISEKDFQQKLGGRFNSERTSISVSDFYGMDRILNPSHLSDIELISSESKLPKMEDRLSDKWYFITNKAQQTYSIYYGNSSKPYAVDVPYDDLLRYVELKCDEEILETMINQSLPKPYKTIIDGFSSLPSQAEREHNTWYFVDCGTDYTFTVFLGKSAEPLLEKIPHNLFTLAVKDRCDEFKGTINIGFMEMINMFAQASSKVDLQFFTPPVVDTVRNQSTTAETMSV